MLVKDTVIVTDSDFDLLTIKFADTINKLKCIVTKYNTHNVVDLSGAGVTAGDISRILAVIDIKYESYVNRRNEGMDIDGYYTVQEFDIWHEENINLKAKISDETVGRIWYFSLKVDVFFMSNIKRVPV